MGARWSKVLVGTKAELEGRDIENDKLCYATDEQRWYRTSAHGAGADVLELVGESGAEYNAAGSFQAAGADLEIGADAGTSEVGESDFVAAAMYNIIGADHDTDHTYLAGVIGAFNVTGTQTTTFPAGAVLGLIGDGVTEADGAFVAVIDGDSAQTRAQAAFKVMCNNSTAGSGVDYGLDLQDAAHDDFLAVDEAFYAKAPIRLPGDVVILVGAGAPVNGTTGDNFAGGGSLYIDKTNKDLYINDGTITDSTWEKLSD